MNFKKSLSLGALVIIALLTSGCMNKLETVKTDSKQTKITNLDKWLKNLNKDEKFSGSVLLAKRGEIIFQKQYGFEDIKDTISLTENSSFNIASLSKPFTAMAIMILQQEQKLQFSDDITKYIPEWDYLSGITIRHLLQHTSGLVDYMYLTDKYWDDNKIFTTNDMIRLFQNQKPKLKFTPGEKYEYSNTGYVILSEIVARVSGKKYADFMAENIFIPLKMKDSAIFNKLSDETVLKHRVYGFSSQGILSSKKVLNDLNYLDGVAGDGGVYTTALDLFKWSQAIKNGTIVSKENYTKAFELTTLNNEKKSDYGFGWQINSDGSYEHSGSWAGFSSYLHTNPKEETLLIILDNSDNMYRIIPDYGLSKSDSITLNLFDFMKKY